MFINHDHVRTTTFTYDSLGRLTTQSLPNGQDACAGSSPQGLTYSYDAASNLTATCDAGGTTSYTYDAANENTGVATDGGSCAPGAVVQPCTTYAYNSLGEKTTVTYPSTTGVVDSRFYDGAGNPTANFVARNGTYIEAMAYSFAAGANDRTLRQMSTNYLAQVRTTYSYDQENHLVGASTGTASTSQTYAYDKDGNLSWETLGGNPTIFAYTASDALSWSEGSTYNTYSYDANGNQIGSSGSTSISYNAQNQTTSVDARHVHALPMTYTGTDSTERTSAGSTTFANSLFGVDSSTTNGVATYVTRDATGGLQSLLVGGTPLLRVHRRRRVGSGPL